MIGPVKQYVCFKRMCDFNKSNDMAKYKQIQIDRFTLKCIEHLIVIELNETF